MEIFHIGAECFPIAKVGGLADVIGALPKYQNCEEHHICVVLPCYQTIIRFENDYEYVYWGKVKLGTFNFPFNVLKKVNNTLGFELYLIDIPELFDRPNIYNCNDDMERFISFQIASLDWISSLNCVPTIIHCHDHHTGLIPFMMKYCYKYEKIKKVNTLITIHNGLYQGVFSFNKLYFLPDFDLIHIHYLERWNCINSLATAIKCADRVTTVSPSYLKELNYTTNGLETLFQNVANKSNGILNGIDVDYWNPTIDRLIYFNYSFESIHEGKKTNKDYLCLRFNLDPNKPLLCFIGRLYYEKGADLLPEIINTVLFEKKAEVSILVLGHGDAEIESKLLALKKNQTYNYNVFIGYDEKLAHQTYASSDFILIPSRIEPCGLTQLYAMQYGTVPIAARTGGLKDTVFDNIDNRNGICFNQTNVDEISNAIYRALDLYNDKESMNKMRSKGMKTDYSWQRVSQKYIELYHLITTNKHES